MSGGVTGGVGLPGLSIATFQKDRTGRTKTTHLFGGAKAKDSPPPKSLPSAPKVSGDKLASVATATKSTAKSPPVATVTSTTAPKLAPLPTKATALIANMPARLDKLDDRIADFVKGSHDLTQASGTKGLGKGQVTELKDVIKGRLALQTEVQGMLADLEKEASGHLGRKDVDKLRTRLVGMAIDLALPELAHSREKTVELGDEARLLVETRTAKSGKGKVDKGPDLHAEHDKLVRQLTDLRTGFAGKADVAEQVTGAFLKALAETSVGRDTKLDAGAKLQTFNAFTHALSKGDVSVGSTPLLRTDDPGVTKLLSGLRSEHYAGDAARNFVLSLDPKKEATLFKQLQKLERQASGDGQLRTIDLKALRGALPTRLHADFDKAVEKGRDAAKLRDAFEDQRTRTARALGTDNAHLAESSVLIKAKGARVVRDGGYSSKASSDVVDAALKKLAKTNVEGSLQVARLALTMEKLAVAEEAALGRNQFGLNTNEKFDAEAILQITGVKEKDITAMGYALDDVGDTFQQNMERLGKAGFEDVGQVKDAMTRMRGLKGVVENRGIQGNLHADLQQQAEATGKLLQREIITDALETVGAKLGPELSDKPDEALKQALTGISTSIHMALFTKTDGSPSKLGTQLDKLQSDIVAYDKELGDLAGDITKAEQEITRHQQVLIAHDADRGKIDTKHPAGLETSKLILKALDLDSRIGTMPDGDQKNALIAERDAALKDLKGFDEKAMKRTWTGKSPFSSSAPPTLAQLQGLKAQAEAIVYLRETGPGLIDQAREDMTEVGIARDTAMAERRQIAPRLFQAIDRIVHLAVASNVPYDQPPSTVKDAFDPSYDLSGAKGKIIAQLQGWGVDTTAFATEIDAALATPITGKTLDAWRTEAGRGSFDDLLETGFIAKEPKTTTNKFADLAKAGVMMIANKREISSQMRTELAALVEALPKNSKFDLAAGTEISLNSGRIPVEPTATVTVRGRVSGSVFKSMVIETGGNGEIKLTGMLGGTIKAGVDLQAALDPLKMAGNNPVEALGAKVEVKVGAELSLDGGYEGAGGFQITFPADDAGKRAAIEAILLLTERQKPSAEIFEQATDVASFKRHKGDGGIKSQLFATAGMFWQPGGNDGDMFADVGGDNSNYKSGAANKHGFGATASVEGRGGLGGKSEITRSLDKATVKTETSSFVSLSGKISAYAQTFSALGMATGGLLTGTGAQQGMDQQFDKDNSTAKVDGSWGGGSATVPYELMNISAETRVTTINKKKLEFAVVGSEGREILAKAEMKELTDGINTPTIHHLVASMSDATLDKLKNDPKKLAEVKEMLAEIKRGGLSSSLVEVTYNIKPDMLTLANELFREADLAMESGDKRTARNLMAAAQQMVDDRDNYAPVKISLIDKTSAKDVANRGMAVLARVDVISSVGTERVKMAVGL